MEDIRMCSRGHALEPLAQTCKFGHETCVRLKCPSKECKFATKPAMKEFQDLLQSEVDEHVKDCHEIKEEATVKNDNAELTETNKKLEKRTCPMCYKLFFSMGNMRAHVKTHHERKGRLNCQKCEKTFSSKNALRYHEKGSHSDGGDLDCESCDQIFSNFEDYSNHRNTHRSAHYQLEHTCDECGKIIRGKHNLSQHLREIHGLETTYNLNKVTVKTYPHNCDKCDAVFKRKSHLNSHIVGIHGGERFPCGQCGKEFQNKSNLNRHIKNIHV